MFKQKLKMGNWTNYFFLIMRNFTNKPSNNLWKRFSQILKEEKYEKAKNDSTFANYNWNFSDNFSHLFVYQSFLLEESKSLSFRSSASDWHCHRKTDLVKATGFDIAATDTVTYSIVGLNKANQEIGILIPKIW